MRRPALLAGLLVLGTAAARGEIGPPPWARTEMREPCAAVEPLRRPLFGELHVHTAASVDAYIFGTRLEPRDAYRFARGETVALPDATEAQTRSTHLERPLDFAAVTDHAEFFGEVSLCTATTSGIFDETLCQALRAHEPSHTERFLTQARWMVAVGVPPPPPRHPFCALPGIDCDAEAVSVWQDIQAAAEEHYDRSAACAFTTFIGFESTTAPLGRHLHRNVIFRNHHVPPRAASHIQTIAGGAPQGLWTAIETECLGAGTGCDAVLIPHNPNLSGGMQWLDPADAAEALRRQTLEPLAEIHQQKGNSECRFDRLAGGGADTADELCTFEVEPLPDQFPATQVPPIEAYPRRNMIRNTLKDGLVLEETLGVNPFRLGFVGSTDSHNATPGNTEEPGWEGGEGGNDASPETQIGDQLHTNPGGLAVVWAEENSRDAIFSALRRRETYATSGTRPVVRFFAGNLDPRACDAPDLVERAYERGTPMGGEVGARRGGRSPRFVAWAARDPGSADRPGTDLARVQVVKGWVDADGQPRERVVDVAGGPNGASVDPATCTPVGAGASELCATWEDPEFDPAQRAFYYARVLENPTCRWSTWVCKTAGADPFAPDCATRAAAAGPAFAGCCRGEANDAFLSPLVQERAWTSPIWYRPDGIDRLTGHVRFGRRPGTDRLDLRLRLAKLPAAFDPETQDLTLRLTDDGEIFALTVSAGTLRGGRARRALGRAARRAAGLEALTLVRHRAGATLRLRTARQSLATADRADHMVTAELAIGTYRAEHTRLWRAAGRRLATEGS